MSASAVAVRRPVIYAAVFAACVAGTFMLRGSAWRGNVETHTTIEIVATLLAFIAGIFALIRYYSRKDGTFLFIGCGFLAAGLLDGYYAFVTVAYSAKLAASAPLLATSWSWLESRFFLSIALLLSSAFGSGDRIAIPPGPPIERTAYGITLTLLFVSLLIIAIVPPSPAYGLSPIIPRPLELIPAAIFALALALYLAKGKWRSDLFEQWLVLALIIGLAGQTAMSLSTQPYDAMVDMAATLKIASYVCVLVALLIDTFRMIRVSALSESRQLLDVIVNTVGATIFWKDRNSVYLGCNTAFAQDAGFSRPEEIIGKNDYQMVWREQADLYRADDRQVIESGHSKLLIEEPQTTPDGRHITLLTNKAPLLGSDGQVIGIVGTYMDISARKRLEEAIRESEKRYRDLVESTTDYVWEINEKRLYTYVSPSVTKLLGYTSEELVGKPMFMILHADEAERFEERIAPIVANRQAYAMLEVTFVGKDGRDAFVETSAAPVFDQHGKYCGYRGIARDITERKRSERALEQRDALVHAAYAIAGKLVTASSLDDAIEQALRLISQVIQVDRIIVLENAEARHGPVLRYLWESPRIAIKIDQAYFQGSAIETEDMLAWVRPLSMGHIVWADLHTAPPSVKVMLEKIGVAKVLLVPIMVDGRYWGQIGFDSCDPERVWAPYESEALQTIAELLGTAIQRDRYVRELADANRIVQNTPTILYRMRGEPSLPMIYVSQNIKLFGHDPAILTASPMLYRSLIHPDDLDTLINSMSQALAGQSGINEFRIMTSKGEFRWVENHFMPLLDRTGRLIEVEGLLSDITERKAAEEKIAHLARTDSLTGLPNRATFNERLLQLFAASRRGAAGFAVHYIDLDRFKNINDTLGHPVGDRLLVVVGERLQQCIRDTDLAGRVGGDEFAVLQSDLADSTSAGALADKLRAAVAAPIQIAGNELHITASIGIAIYGPETSKPEDMLAQADVALYRAKDDGRDQYRFHTEELDTAVREEVALSDELRKALEHHELELYYQPQIEFSTNAIVGMEALIRWNHPTRGLLLPGQFIELAERTGTIVPIGHWVLDAACRQMSTWRAAGVAPQSIAVNVSAVQIKGATEFVELVTATLEKWHLAPSDLELDVTESTIARATLAQNDVLERLQKLGVKIAIDDFGMKYSSLDYLRTYHVNRIKVPQLLIDAASQDQDSAAMARAILGIARELNIEVIAEGVESEAQWLFLAKSPVAKVQGYYYSKPVPAGDATNLLIGKHIMPRASADP
ncbi:EAL domain-containing protein [Pseudolabrys sp. Root1462]|uniref:EAL domain-containing protein n=1 Tax=Pseudolabrys sp. Root1462 TaxID=1736466 RepID=UPI0009E9194C|nr:EAL domain-containing protein [Pseudolabrys sp. Root1462]